MRFMKDGLVYNTLTSQCVAHTKWTRYCDSMEMFAYYITPNGAFWHIHKKKPRRWFKWLVVKRDQEEARWMFAHESLAKFLGEIADRMGHEEAIRVGEQLGAPEA